MTLMTCKRLRAAVVVALGLFALGLTLQAPRFLLPEDATMITTLLSGVGLLAIIFSPILMILAAALSLLPRVSRKLFLCEH